MPLPPHNLKTAHPHVRGESTKHSNASNKSTCRSISATPYLDSSKESYHSAGQGRFLISCAAMLVLFGAVGGSGEADGSRPVAIPDDAGLGC
jgi:hypothetical protein